MGDQMDPLYLVIMTALALIGLGAGWSLGSRQAAAFRAERDARLDDFRKAITDLAAAEERAKLVPDLQAELTRLRADSHQAQTELARLNAAQDERERAYEAR